MIKKARLSIWGRVNLETERLTEDINNDCDLLYKDSMWHPASLCHKYWDKGYGIGAEEALGKTSSDVLFAVFLVSADTVFMAPFSSEHLVGLQAYRVSNKVSEHAFHEAVTWVCKRSFFSGYIQGFNANAIYPPEVTSCQ